MQDTIAIPANAAPGTLTITPFLRDSLGQRATGPSITITVQTAAQINSVPVVNHTAPAVRPSIMPAVTASASKSPTRCTSKPTIRAASLSSVTRSEARRRTDRRFADLRLERAADVPAAHVRDEASVHDLPDDRLHPGVRAEHQRCARVCQASRAVWIVSIR